MFIGVYMNNVGFNNFTATFVSRDEAQLISKICHSPISAYNINDLDYILAYKNLNHELLHCNTKLLKYTGHKNINNIVGKTDYDLIWENFADIYHKQENDAKSNQVYIALHPGIDTDGRNFVFFNRKYPWKDEHNNIIGIICQSIEIGNPSLIELGSILKQTSLTKLEKIHYIGSKDCSLQLTTREHECLFYILRGKTAKCISRFLGISPRTVEAHIDNIKLKLSCKTKSELIIKAIDAGLMQAIPNSLFNHNLADTLKEK